MQLPQRLSITGMGGLAAAFSMPLILASFVPVSWHTPDASKFHRTYLWILVFTASGLCSWVFMQVRSHRSVFDANDIVATVFGSILAYLAFRWNVSRCGRVAGG